MRSLSRIEKKCDSPSSYYSWQSCCGLPYLPHLVRYLTRLRTMARPPSAACRKRKGELIRHSNFLQKPSRVRDASYATTAVERLGLTACTAYQTARSRPVGKTSRQGWYHWSLGLGLFCLSSCAAGGEPFIHVRVWGRR